MKRQVEYCNTKTNALSIGISRVRAAWCIAGVLLFCMIVLMIWIKMEWNMNCSKCGHILEFTDELYECVVFVDKTIFLSCSKSYIKHKCSQSLYLNTSDQFCEKRKAHSGRTVSTNKWGECYSYSLLFILTQVSYFFKKCFKYQLYVSDFSL